jgi:hypothetical protein
MIYDILQVAVLLLTSLEPAGARDDQLVLHYLFKLLCLQFNDAAHPGKMSFPEAYHFVAFPLLSHTHSLTHTPLLARCRRVPPSPLMSPGEVTASGVTGRNA